MAGDTRADEDGSGTGAGEGTDTLLLAFEGPAVVEVGALGSIAFEREWYASTGSAFGPGGFARVERHRELAAGERDTRHWHVDYLLGHPGGALARVVRTPDREVECPVARTLAAGFDPVPAFGASDCDCPSHPVGAPDRESLLAAVERAHDSAVPAGERADSPRTDERGQ